MRFDERKQVDRNSSYPVIYCVSHVLMEKIKKEILEVVASDDLLHSDWKRIFRIINNEKFFTANKFDFWECIYFITNVFQAKKCQNVSVISNVLRLAWLKSSFETAITDEIDDAMIYYSSESASESDDEINSTINNDEMNSAEYEGKNDDEVNIIHDDEWNFIENNNEVNSAENDDVILGIDFPPTNDFIDISCYCFNIFCGLYRRDCLIDTILSGNVYFFKVLLNFGVVIMPPPLRVTAYCKYLLQPVLERYDIDLSWSAISHHSPLEDDLKPEEKNTLFYVMCTLDILASILGSPENTMNILQISTLLFKSSGITQTHITSREVRIFLENFFLRFLTLMEVVDDILADYERIFPESTYPCGARSLQDLCRWRIRESLRIAKTIWFGVPLLPLPTYLKKFILFETKDN